MKKTKKENGMLQVRQNKLLGHRKNYYKIYCIDCAKEYKEGRSKHFWFCTDDCPQK